MKRLMLILLLFLGCYAEPQETCTKYYDLCDDGGSDYYYICADAYGSWFEVYGETYYTVDYMLMVECDFYE